MPAKGSKKSFTYEESLASVNYLALEFSDQNVTTPDKVRLLERHNKYKWNCNFGHTYECTPERRYIRKYGCGYCNGTSVCKENSIAGKLPEFLSEFDYEKNTLPPSKIYFKYTKKIWWLCQKRHSYDASPLARISTETRKGTGCPYCSGNKVCYETSLKGIFPLLAEEFNSDKNNILPENIFAKSGKSYWWVCKRNNHNFIMSPHNRSKGLHCDQCVIKDLEEKYSIAARFPQDKLIEYDLKKNILSPTRIKAKSNVKCWWLCTKLNHSYLMSPEKRYIGQGCKNCNKSGSSKREEELRKFLGRYFSSSHFANSENRRIAVPFGYFKSMEVDVLFTYKKAKVVVEYDGVYYHSLPKNNNANYAYEKDKRKTKSLLEAGYYVVRLREVNQRKLAFIELESPQLLQLHVPYNSSFELEAKRIEEWLVNIFY